MTEPHRSQPDLVVLQTLRCIGFTAEERIVSASGMDPDGATRRLRELAAAGLVDHQAGPFGGWGLTDRGRSTARELVADELESTDARHHVARSYRSFLQLNPVLLDVCGDWQMRGHGSTQILNDHRDADYDAGVLSRLIRVDDEAQAICGDLTARLARFGLYGRRLSTSLERAMAGEAAFVADSVDSYHTVWFHLHEDLLTTLDISREEEREGRAPDR